MARSTTAKESARVMAGAISDFIWMITVAGPNTRNSSRRCVAQWIVRLPGHQAVTGNTEAIVESIEIYPTLCEFAELKTPIFLDGESFLSVITGKHGKRRVGIGPRAGNGCLILIFSGGAVSSNSHSTQIYRADHVLKCVYNIPQLSLSHVMVQ